MQDSEIFFLPATELRQRFRRRELSPVEVAQTVIAHLERLQPTLNAFVTTTPEIAMDRARAAEDAYAAGRDRADLLGVPVTIKDVTFTRGVRTARGSLLYSDFVPDEDAPVVERFNAAGALMLGKTTTPELGWKGDSGNRVNGPARNPWNPERTPGGSSGGASAAVAAGIGPIAQGTDGAGSVRIPPAFCGVYGIKPSYGLIPYYPPSAIPGLAHNGPITRTVRDAALALNVMSGPDARDPHSLGDTGVDYLAACERPVDGLRVAWSPDLGYAPIDPRVRAITERAARAFSDLGCHVEEVDPGIPDPYRELDLIWSTAQAAPHAADLGQVQDQLDPGRLTIIQKGLTVSGLELAQSYAYTLNYTDRWRRFMERYDLLLTPSLPVTAFPAGDDMPGPIQGTPSEYLGWTKFTYPFNLTGQPAATVPCGFDRHGLPVGLQIVGRWRDDATVLAASAAFEAYRPWADAIPPVLPELAGV